MADFIIPIYKPYDFNKVLAFLKKHVAYGIEEIKNNRYFRYIPYEDSYITLEVAQNNEESLIVSISGNGLSDLSNNNILNRVKQLFDTEHDPYILPEIFGLRVIGCFDPFEVAISIILGQMVSVPQATKKLEQFIKLFGNRITDKIYIFPTAKDLINKEIAEIGITKIKAGAIKILAQKISDKEFSFLNKNKNDLTIIEKELLSIKGIGSWTAQMIMMRCFQYKDAFPKNDLVIQRVIREKFVDENIWKPNRAYLTHYIWNNFYDTSLPRN